MPTIGIIAEYNPFHSGHRHHIQTVRRTFGADSAIVCAMSGNWVQRGQPPWRTSGPAPRSPWPQGVDLVLELPTLWAAASAEPFARGGVGLLAATGVVDILSFGSEAGDLAPLQQVAHCLHSPAWKTELRRALDKGLSFPAARQAAATALLGSAADCLGQPNNNLGVEYLLAIRTLGAKLTPHTIPAWGPTTTRRRETRPTPPPPISAKSSWQAMRTSPPISPTTHKSSCGPTRLTSPTVPAPFWPACGG